MFQIPDMAIDHLKDVPGFKGLLKAVIKSQIQLLLEQLAKHTDEESIILSASVTDGAFSHMASETAKDFLCDKEELKSQFLRHCLTAHHKHESREGELETPLPSVDRDVSHESFFKRMKRTMGTVDSYHHHQVTKPDLKITSNPMSGNKSRSTHEVSRRKRLKVVQPTKYHRPPSFVMPSNFGIYDTPSTSNDHNIPNTETINNVYDTHVDINSHTNNGNENVNSSLDESCEDISKMKLKTIPVKVEIDSDKQERIEDDIKSETSSIQDQILNTTKAIIENHERLKQIESLSSDVPLTGSVGESAVVDLSVSGTNNSHIPSNNSFSAIDESHNVFASHLYGNLPLMTVEQSQGYILKPRDLKIPKKRVYRKVECDICHKLVYITNIKVHRYRHTQHMESLQ